MAVVLRQSSIAPLSRQGNERHLNRTCSLAEKRKRQVRVGGSENSGLLKRGRPGGGDSRNLVAQPHECLMNVLGNDDFVRDDKATHAFHKRSRVQKWPVWYDAAFILADTANRVSQPHPHRGYDHHCGAAFLRPAAFCAFRRRYTCGGARRSIMSGFAHAAHRQHCNLPSEAGCPALLRREAYSTRHE